MAIINGTSGDDVLFNNVGESDTIDGGAGTDTVSYASAGGAGGGVVVDLDAGYAFDLTNGDEDTLTSFENVTGSAFDDTLVGNAGANVLDGGAGVDQLYGADGDDTLNAGDAGDQLFGQAGNDTLHGDAGDDFVDGGLENDALFGDAGNDSLLGDSGDDTLIGGTGNDTLDGGLGADVFKFSFESTPGGGGGGGETLQFTDWLSEKYDRDFGDELPDFSPKHHQHHKHGKNDERRGGDDDNDGHHAQGGGLTEKFFETNYKQWLNEVVVADLLDQGFVLDANGNGKIKIDINEDSRNGTPRIEGLTRDELAAMFGDRDSVILRDGHEAEKAFYSNSYTSQGGGQDTVTSGDGFDTIVDFTFGLGGDKLEFNGLAGLTLDQFTSLFAVTEADVNGDAITDTILALTDASWDVTLVGVSGHTEADFFAASNFT